MKEIKCIVVGDAGVGKACLINTYLNGEFPEIMEPAVFQHFFTVSAIEGKQCKMQLWYANGMDKYSRMRLLAYPGTDIVLLCFSVDDRESLESARVNWVEEIHAQLPDAPIILVGTKIDTREIGSPINFSEPTEDDAHKPISYQEGLSIASEIGAVKYHEVSSRFNVGITTLFQDVGKTIQNVYVIRKKQDRCKGCSLM